jgi:hypothetical protein
VLVREELNGPCLPSATVARRGTLCLRITEAGHAFNAGAFVDFRWAPRGRDSWSPGVRLTGRTGCDAHLRKPRLGRTHGPEPYHQSRVVASNEAESPARIHTPSEITKEADMPTPQRNHKAKQRRTRSVTAGRTSKARRKPAAPLKAARDATRTQPWGNKPGQRGKTLNGSAALSSPLSAGMGIVLVRTTASLELPRRLAMCRTPTELWREQARFIQEGFADYTRYLASWLPQLREGATQARFRGRT